MKKLLLIYFQLFVISLFSQEQSFQIGIKTGAGISKMFVEKAAQDRFNIQASYSLMNGVNFNYKTKGVFQVEADLLFTRKGYFRQENLTFEDSTTLLFKQTESLDYFNISILPGIQTKGNTSFKINAGPYVGFLYNVNLVSKTEGSKPRTINNKPSRLSLNQKIDFGAAMELSLVQKLSEKLFFKVGSRTEMSIYNQVAFFQYKSPKFFTSNVFVGLNYRLK